MRDSERAFEFGLATQMCCTVAELRERISQREFVAWAGYLTWKHKAEADAANKARRAAERQARRR